DRAGGHELHELAEERTRLVYGIKSLGLLAGHANALLRDDPKSRLLDQRIDCAGEITRGGVRLDDREGSFNRHVLVLKELFVLKEQVNLGVAGLYRRGLRTASDRGGACAPWCRCRKLQQFHRG